MLRDLIESIFIFRLKGHDAEFITPKGLAITAEPEETGTTPEENAIFKAKFYGQYRDAVICNDSWLYFEELALEDIAEQVFRPIDNL